MLLCSALSHALLLCSALSRALLLCSAPGQCLYEHLLCELVAYAKLQHSDAVAGIVRRLYGACFLPLDQRAWRPSLQAVHTALKGDQHHGGIDP